MLRVTQARQQNASAGEPILAPFSVFEANKLHLRKGNLILVAAGPGTGKTALVHSIVQRGDDAGRTNSTIFFSADSSAWDLYTRAAAIATGRTMDDIEAELNEHGSARLDAIVNDATKHMWMSFRSDPSDQYVLEQVQAYAAIYGSYPEVIVVDVLKALEVGNGDDEFRALEEACVFLHDLAKDTSSAVIALHHVRGDLEDGFSQIPLSGIRGKVSKTPAQILTLHRGMSSLNVSIVKNRGGKADATGSLFCPIVADLSRMSFQG